MINSDVMEAIGKISKRLARWHWSETEEDLIHDGIVLVLQLYQKRPNADNDWIYKSLHNFYSSKNKKMNRYEEKNISLDELLLELPDTNVANIPELEDSELDAIRYLLETTHLSRNEIEKQLGVSKRTLYSKIQRAKHANLQK